MNPELKASIKEGLDLEALTKAIIAKNYAAAIGLVMTCIQDATGLIAGWTKAEWLAELKGLLANPAADADLVADIAATASVGGNSTKATAVIAAIVQWAVWNIEGFSGVETALAS
jgi:hypothetical protein